MKYELTYLSRYVTRDPQVLRNIWVWGIIIVITRGGVCIVYIHHLRHAITTLWVINITQTLEPELSF